MVVAADADARPLGPAADARSGYAFEVKAAMAWSRQLEFETPGGLTRARSRALA